MKVVRNFRDNKFHLIRKQETQRTKCGRLIKTGALSKWGHIHSKDSYPKNLCKKCSEKQAKEGL